MNVDHPMNAPILSVENLSKTYGAVTVLSDVSFDIAQGEVVAILGENGAGKSTLSSLIAGLTPPGSGRMHWQGKPYAPRNPNDALQAGISLIHQETQLLPELSIAENMFIGHLPMCRLGRWGWKVDRKAMVSQAQIYLERLGLDMSAKTAVKYLKVAHCQKIEIAKALSRGAKFLLLDEPTAALDLHDTQLLFKQIRELKAQGVSFIYVSHRLEEIAQIADRILVLRDGALVARHDTADIPVTTLVEAMVGRPLERMFPLLPPPQTDSLLEIHNLHAPRNAYQDISLSVRKGEIMGIAGIVGAGRTELVRAIAGMDPPRAGHIIVNGRQSTVRNRRDALNAGIVLVPEDRKGQALLLETSIADNLALGNERRISANGWMTRHSIHAWASAVIRRFTVKGKAEQKVAELSGGNQQKVVIARAICTQPSVVILDEPTRGIDVGARATIYEDIVRLAQSGIGIVIVSSDLDEVIGLSHRVMVMARGRNQGILSGNDINRVNIMQLAVA